MKIKTSELTGAALDWAVAQAIGKPCHLHRINHRDRHPAMYVLRGENGISPAYSTDWSQAGPIIAREEISTAKLEETLPDAMAPHPACWSGHIDGAFVRYGPTPLVAAMRCYVASKLGDEVEVPDELH